MKYLPLLLITLFLACEKETWQKADCIPNELNVQDCTTFEQLKGVWSNDTDTLVFSSAYVEYDNQERQWIRGSKCDFFSLVLEPDNWDAHRFNVSEDSLRITQGTLKGSYLRLK